MPSDLQIGDLGNGKSHKINDDLAADLRPFRMPYAKTLDKVGATLFPDAEHVMLLIDSLQAHTKDLPYRLVESF